MAHDTYCIYSHETAIARGIGITHTVAVPADGCMLTLSDAIQNGIHVEAKSDQSVDTRQE